LDAAVDRAWSNALREGDFERAWRISDRSLRDYCGSGAVKHSGERHHQRIWRGEDLAGQRVLVRCYHGLGDTIQFVRFAGVLRRVAREVVVWCQPELMSLLRSVDGVDDVVALHDGTPEVAYDVDIEIMELAHALRADSALISGSVPYLKTGAVTRRRPLLDCAVAVGLVWEAGGWDRRRCVPPQALAGLNSLPGVGLYSLQQGPARGMATTIPAKDIAVPDLDSLAATIVNLDIVITVDTMVAHLAGALGANVWTMLHADCDWRWPAGGRHTIWYPTMRLFHQVRTGDWSTVVEQIADELKGFRSPGQGALTGSGARSVASRAMR
jgi:hypothetical protein